MAMILAGLVAIVVTISLTPVYINMARRCGLIAQPAADGSTVHIRPTPTAGGIAICVAVLIAGTTTMLLGASPINSIWPVVVISAGGGALCVAGLLDDVARLPWYGKMSLEVTTALAVIAAGVHLQVFPLAICLPVSMLWILGVTNAVNLIDGMDGLAAGISLLAAASLGIIAWSQGAQNMAVLAAAVCGASAGFLVYNFYPSKLFMGDAGSLFLGFMLAVIPLTMVTTVERLSVFFAAVIVLGLPIFDTLSSMVRRAFHRQSVFSGDLGHYYNQLISRYGHSQRAVAIGSYTLGAVLGILGVVSSALWWPQALAMAVVVYLLLTVVYLKMGFLNYPQQHYRGTNGPERC